MLLSSFSLGIRIFTRAKGPDQCFHGRSVGSNCDVPCTGNSGTWTKGTKGIFDLDTRAPNTSPEWISEVSLAFLAAVHGGQRCRRLEDSYDL